MSSDSNSLNRIIYVLKKCMQKEATGDKIKKRDLNVSQYQVYNYIWKLLKSDAI